MTNETLFNPEGEAGIPVAVLTDYKNRTVVDVLSPRWINAEHTMFDADVLFAELEPMGHVPFSAAAHCDTDHGKEIWNNGIAGNYGPIAEFIEPEPEPVVFIIPALTLWERMTNQEAEQVDEAMASQPFRIRQIFLTAPTFRSDHELWPLLEQIASQLFGAVRAAELLAP